VDRKEIVKEFTASESGRLARYHYSETGAKTWLVMRGCVQVIQNGKRFVLTEGDIFNAEAWRPYSLTLLTKDTVVREISASGLEPDREMPDPAGWIDADKLQILEASCKCEGVYEFGAEGIKLILKVGRWQLDGYKEIWEYRIDKGFRLAFNGNSEREGLYIVSSGLFRMELDGREIIVGADEEDIVRIPPGAVYAFTALSEDSAIQDFNVACQLFRLLEMVEAARDYFPEKLQEQAYMEYLLEANKVVAFESFGKEGNE